MMVMVGVGVGIGGWGMGNGLGMLLGLEGTKRVEFWWEDGWDEHFVAGRRVRLWVVFAVEVSWAEGQETG